MVQEELLHEARRLREIKNEAQKSLNRAPEGSLVIAHRSNSLQYYQRIYMGKEGKRDVYLAKGDMKIAQRLAQKGYDKKILKQVEKQLKAIDIALDALSGNKQDSSSPLPLKPNRQSALAELSPIRSVFEGLDEERKRLVVPYELPDEEYGRVWEDEALSHAPIDRAYPLGLQFKTQRGHLVRSKSEVIIADRLLRLGVPYVYEKPLVMRSGQSLMPDFTVLNKRTRREFLWEHFGLMDNPEYCTSALRKINAYASEGLVLGSGFIATFETESCPLDLDTVDACIETYLL